MTARRLIVTADDVGLHRGMTEGAIRAHVDGIVTACSVVANGAAFAHAVERLRDVPSLAVGVHLTLVEERPISANIASLTGTNGLFHESWTALVPRYFLRRIRMDEVERELRAQIERVLQTGLTVTHANGHQHLHLLPRVFEIVLRLAAEYRIPYVRIVDEDAEPSVRGASIGFLSALGRKARKVATVKTNDGTLGVLQAGQIRDANTIVALLPNVSGTTELVCHPGIGDDQLRTSYDWGYEWDAETNALCDPALRAAIAAAGIELATP